MFKAIIFVTSVWNLRKVYIQTPEQCIWYCSAFFIISFEQLSHICITFVLIASNVGPFSQFILRNQPKQPSC